MVGPTRTTRGTAPPTTPPATPAATPPMVPPGTPEDTPPATPPSTPVVLACFSAPVSGATPDGASIGANAARTSGAGAAAAAGGAGTVFGLTGSIGLGTATSASVTAVTIAGIVSGACTIGMTARSGRVTRNAIRPATIATCTVTAVP